MPDNATKTAKYGGIVFKEKIKAFADKLNLPTETYTDIWDKQHAKAFVVAGAMQDDLLSDLKRAVLNAVDGGSTLADFRNDFDAAVAKAGWDYSGGRNWRSRVIYETNTRMAYSSGRYQQMQAVKRSRPFWQYEHSGAENARPQHLAWNNMVLMADDPWWRTHYPPNGYGCDCRVRTLSQRDLDRKGINVSTSPDVIWTDKTVGVTTNPRTVKVTDGVDAGFAYNVGEATWGEQLSKTVYDKEIAKLQNQSKWQSMEKLNWESYQRPSVLDVEAMPRNKQANASRDTTELLTELMGSDERVFNVAGAPMLLNASFLAEHISPERNEFLPLLIDALENPLEVWQTFEYHKVSKRVSIKRRVVGSYALGNKMLNIVLSVRSGVLVSWTVVPLNLNRINKIRKGTLVFAR